MFERRRKVARVNREKPMKEILYRESRVARVLGEPSKYAIVELLMRAKSLNVSEISRSLRRAESTISHHLALLKSLEIVRYEVHSGGVYYWIKYPKDLQLVMDALRDFVRRTQKGLDHDT
jgi:DNA-binding transcriptional ArsR family regulator